MIRGRPARHWMKKCEPLWCFRAAVLLVWAALELWNAARTDADLRGALVPVEKEVFGTLHERSRELLEESAPGDPRLATVVQFSFEVLTGLAMTGIVSGDLSRRELLIRRWKRAAAILLGRRDPATLVETVNRP